MTQSYPIVRMHLQVHSVNGIVSDESVERADCRRFQLPDSGLGTPVTSAQTWDLSHQSPDLLPPGGVLVRPDVLPAGAGPSADQYSWVVLSPVLESARLARDFTRTTLRDWQLDMLAYEAVIIASELVTNAIRHGVSFAAGGSERPDVGLAWQRHASRLICVVTDPSATPPVLTTSGPDAESGRGLQVVQALAAAWGWMMLSAQEKAVWAALLLPVGS